MKILYVLAAIVAVLSTARLLMEVVVYAPFLVAGMVVGLLAEQISKGVRTILAK